MRNLRMLFALALVGAICAGLPAFANAAPGTLHAFIPGGISGTNPQADLSTVLSRASVDANTAQGLARTGGSSTFVESAYSAVGYASGAPGSANSGISNVGTVVPTADTKECNAHSRMFVIKDSRTGGLIYICVKCGNIRLHVQHPVRPHPFAKGTVLKVSKTFTHTFTEYCLPNKQSPVVVTVTTWVHGLVRAATWGSVIGRLNDRINASFLPKINQTVKVKCSVQNPSAPPPPPAPMPQPPIVVVVVTPTCVGANACSNNPPPIPTTFVATATVSAAATASATANCPSGSVSATATASASGSGSGSGFGTSTVSQQDAQNKANDAANANAQAAATANAQANAQAAASAKCTPAPPPSAPPGLVISNLSAPQLAPGGIAPDGEIVSFCVDTQDTKAGNTVKLTFKATLGSFASIVTFTSTGADKECAVFAAPNDSADIGATEHLTVTSIDTTAGVVGNTLTGSFVYQTPPNGGIHPTN
jgi:hypothetical protein